MHRPLPRFCAAAPALLLASLAAGCAAPGDFPSLQPRPIERALAEADAAPDPVPAPADAETVGKAEALLGKIQGGGRDFGALLPEVRRRAAAAGASGSDSWIEAQQALSRLEATRAETVKALADLDAFALAQADAGANPATVERLGAITAEGQGIADAQRGEIERLQASLSG
ncbi:MAG: hypothetical protein E6G94_10795 [Alphaproteobacteria bacterium]|nr:MAG: hypothetical protein E6G94_10795 [Alphaproteobacteria bacterium]